jgi:hypothetical protein
MRDEILDGRGVSDPSRNVSTFETCMTGVMRLRSGVLAVLKVEQFFCIRTIQSYTEAYW